MLSSAHLSVFSIVCQLDVQCLRAYAFDFRESGFHKQSVYVGRRRGCLVIVRVHHNKKIVAAPVRVSLSEWLLAPEAVLAVAMPFAPPVNKQAVV